MRALRISVSCKKFKVYNDKFKLFINGNLVSESGYVIEKSDKWFKEPYLTLHDLKTFENFQGKGYAKFLMTKIIEFTKSKLKLNVISLIVNKDNFKALNLYSDLGFKIFMEYDASYCLVLKF